MPSLYLRHLIWFLSALIITMTAGAGCRLPFRGALPQDETPAVPDEIDTGKGEPVLIVYLHEEGRVQEMELEEYITGVVAGEMKNDWPEDALAAQSIIARSFTLQKISEEGGVSQRGAHASTDIEEFQAYNAAEINDNVRSAVEKTRGEVAVFNGNFIRGWFHAYAGPRTAQADEGLEFEGGNPPYIQVVDSPGKRIVPPEEGSWKESFALDQVRAAVSEITGENPGKIENIEIAEKGPSGRTVTLLVNDVKVSAPSLRIALGSTEMRSTFINEIEIDNNKVTFSGEGYGHGVGMCQWGARALAEEGNAPEEIVKYFYEGVEIVKLWE